MEGDHRSELHSVRREEESGRFGGDQGIPPSRQDDEASIGLVDERIERGEELLMDGEGVGGRFAIAREEISSDDARTRPLPGEEATGEFRHCGTRHRRWRAGEAEVANDDDPVAEGDVNAQCAICDGGQVGRRRHCCLCSHLHDPCRRFSRVDLHGWSASAGC